FTWPHLSFTSRCMLGAIHDFTSPRTSGTARLGTARCRATPALARTREPLPPTHRPGGNAGVVHPGLDCLSPPAERAGHLCLARRHAQRTGAVLAGCLAGHGSWLRDLAGLRVVGQPLCRCQATSPSPEAGRF